jgi:peroxiredoxin Q/BCP
MALEEGSLAPDFSLSNDNNVTIQLSNYRGRMVVLYFYPRDDTPGCTTEACSFRDNFEVYKKAGAVILGVSADKPKSHEKFREKYRLPYPLLSDPDHRVCELYHVWGRKKIMGREYDGIFRTTFLINEKGRIEKIFTKVKPSGHSDEVIAAIRALKEKE